MNVFAWMVANSLAERILTIDPITTLGTQSFCRRVGSRALPLCHRPPDAVGSSGSGLPWLAAVDAVLWHCCPPLPEARAS